MPFPTSSFARSGRFTEIYPIGRGAAGQVYAATDNLGRQVAVKEALPGSEGFAAFRAKFEKEARLQATLHHANIVRVYHLEQDPETSELYLICEYANAGSLADYLAQRGPLPEALALRLALHVCAALEEIERQQIVHRDIKPSNILLSQDEQGQLTAKLGDFGIAQDNRLRKTTILPGTTHPGTPLYMAPEQADATAILDTRTDIFALGVTLWEMLTGEDYKTLLRDTQLPALRSYSPAAQPGTATVIGTAMQSQREFRYQRAAELRADLERLLAGKAPLAKPTPQAAPQPTVGPWEWPANSGFEAIAVYGGALVGAILLGMSGWIIWGLSQANAGLPIALLFLTVLFVTVGLLARREAQAGRGLRVLLLLLVVGTFGACAFFNFVPAPQGASFIAPLMLLGGVAAAVATLLGTTAVAKAAPRTGRYISAVLTILGGSVLAAALLFGGIALSQQSFASSAGVAVPTMPPQITPANATAPALPLPAVPAPTAAPAGAAIPPMPTPLPIATPASVQGSSRDCVQGSGNVVSQERPISDVSAITLNTLGSVTVRQGERESLTVVTDDTILPSIRTEVQNGNLTMGLSRGCVNNMTRLDFELTVNDLRSVTVNSLGTVDLQQIATETLDVRVNGLGSVRATGKAPQLSVDIEGLGQFRGDQLISQQATVHVKGSGNVYVRAEQSLNATVDGLGSIVYYGKPNVTPNINGAGSIKPGD